jgi:hypothetical protein
MRVTLEETLEVAFSMRSVSYWRRVFGFVLHPLIVAKYQFGKDVLEAA